MVPGTVDDVTSEVFPASGADWQAFRRLRLNSLRLAPDSYRRVYADEVTAPLDRWAPFLDRMAADDNAAVLLAEIDAVAVGLAFLGLDTVTFVMSLGGMWVEPEARGRGVGRALVDAGLAWGLARGAAASRLAVSIGNAAAEHLYRSAGFTPTGETEALREDSDVQIAWLERVL